MQNRFLSAALTTDWSLITALSLAYQQVDTQMMTKLLSLLNQIELLVLTYVPLDAAVILQLTQLLCPRLDALAFSYDGLSSVAMSHLAQGKWPLLKELNLQGNELGDTALNELFTGKWPSLEELELTVKSLHGKAITKWLGLSSDSVQQAIRHPEQDVQVSEWKVECSGSSADMQPPLQHMRHVYPHLATVTLYPPAPLPAMSID